MKEQKFIKEIHSLIDQVLKSNRETEKEKLEMLAFGILVTIDGESLADGPYSLRPINNKGKEGKDIAGNLHNLFYKIRDEKVFIL